MEIYWGLQGRGQNCFEYQLQHVLLIHKPHSLGLVCPMAETWLWLRCWYWKTKIVFIHTMSHCMLVMIWNWNLSVMASATLATIANGLQPFFLKWHWISIIWPHCRDFISEVAIVFLIKYSGDNLKYHSSRWLQDHRKCWKCKQIVFIGKKNEIMVTMSQLRQLATNGISLS